MDSQKLQVRGNLDEFLHSGALIMVIMWIIVAGVLFIINPKIQEQIQIQQFIALFFLAIISIPAIGILLQKITVDNEFVIYSSNLLPLFPRKIPISNISFIGFNMDLTLTLPLNRSPQDLPPVGLWIADMNGKPLGGFNTKVFKAEDLKLVIKKIIEVNPNVKTDYL